MTNSPQHGSITQLTFERPDMKPMKKKQPTQEQISKLEWLVDKGMSIAAAAKVVDVPYSTAWRYLTVYKAPAKPQAPENTKARKRTKKRAKKQMRKDERTIKQLIAEGMQNTQIADAIGLTLKQVEMQISRGKLRAKAKRKPRIVYAKPTFWQKCKRIISNLWG